MGTTINRGFEERCLLDGGINSDPYPYLAELREYAPVYWSRIHQSWMITGYGEVAWCLQADGISADRVSPMLNNASTRRLDEDVDRSFQILSKWMAFNDSSEHRRLRSAFREAFGRTLIPRYQPLIRRIVEQQLVQLRHRGGRCDIVTDFVQPISKDFFSQFLGVSPADRDVFYGWTSQLAELILGMPIAAERYRRSHQSLVKLFDYFQLLVRERQRNPREDLISTVLETGLEAVTEDEFVAMLTHLAFAGAETTSNLITNGIRAILMDGDQLRILRSEPQHIETAIDEFLRFDGPLKLLIRQASSDLELNGQTIKRGSRLYLMIAAANRDPLLFNHPDLLDVRRNPNAHFGFGRGGHSCLGALLGYVVARETIGSLLREFPDLALDGEASEWRLSLMARSAKAVLVRY